MEAGDASVSLNLLVRSLLAMGESNSDLAKIIAGSHVRQKAAQLSLVLCNIPSQIPVLPPYIRRPCRECRP